MPPHPQNERDIAELLQSRKTRFLLVAMLCTTTFVLLIFLFSPYFNINEVHIIGNSRVSEDEIRDSLEVTRSSHLLLFNTRTAGQRVLENMYIGAVEFERILPGRLIVTVTERRLTAYVEHTGGFLFLDDTGRVLDVRQYITDSLPILEGLQFTRFQLGEILEVPDTAAFNVIVQYAQLLNHHGLIQRVSHINVTDAANIRINIENIEFNVGGISDADEKIRTISAIIAAKPNVGLIPGFVDLRERRQDNFFEILQ
ncbi:MAG: FtsQ-type POTRA domain-containing protein [Defluviitaleaceae bacterium]|nr:FtsQ-type POTRA domain-containing protein [Defluviitaleaceae bacterium]